MGSKGLHPQKKEGREGKSKSGGKVKVLLSGAQKVLKFYTVRSGCVLARNSGQAIYQRLRDMLFRAKKNIVKINVFFLIFDLTEIHLACPVLFLR